MTRTVLKLHRSGKCAECGRRCVRVSDVGTKDKAPLVHVKCDKQRAQYARTLLEGLK